MITLDGEQWAMLTEAANRFGVSYAAMQKWVSRHRSTVPTRRVGTAIVVRMESLSEYQRREARK